MIENEDEDKDTKTSEDEISLKLILLSKSKTIKIGSIDQLQYWVAALPPLRARDQVILQVLQGTPRQRTQGCKILSPRPVALLKSW